MLQSVDVGERSLDAQLVLTGSMPLDDPEGWRIYHELTADAADDPKIRVLTNLTGVGNVEINALQRLSDAVIQKSLREGFGLVVSEALWKRTPVVAGRAGGIPLQMADRAGDALVDTVEECASQIAALLRDRDRGRAIAEHGHQRVREHFLTPRLVLNELCLMSAIVEGVTTPTAHVSDATARDPVCGMAITDPAAPSVTHDGNHYSFCSQECQARFLDRPERFLPRPGPPRP